MVRVLHSIRRARPADADAIAAVHDEAWREAYRGIIPGRSLEAMIARRGPGWWLSAIRRGSRMLVLEFDNRVVGYVSYGRNRVAAIPYAGEIFELYLAPAFQGVGLGERLFNAAREDLAAKGYFSVIVWALLDNERALRFYKKMGGVEVWRAAEQFDNDTRARVAFGFAAT
ncbi:MAG: GNAT family N-acetyltransferase [Hyphomicrobiales bacterium]|nr:GNAT family N-acetyltransferase [Hyphomicrobiales bacterium]